MRQDSPHGRSAGLVDLHAHVLPGVDDGPGDLFETVELLRAAHRQGTRTIVATPHMFLHPFDNREPGELWRVYLALLESLGTLGEESDTAFLAEMNVYLGAEHFYCEAFLEALEKEEVLPLKDTRHLLVEFSPLASAEEVAGGTGRIIAAGYVPVVAHVERYLAFNRVPERLETLRELGCVVQVNAASLIGWMPSRLRSATWEMLESGWIDVVASDAHGTRRRTPRLGDAARQLRRRLSAETAIALTRDNPARVIGLAYLEVGSP